jgi:hypothetical protein
MQIFEGLVEGVADGGAGLDGHGDKCGRTLEIVRGKRIYGGCYLRLSHT